MADANLWKNITVESTNLVANMLGKMGVIKVSNNVKDNTGRNQRKSDAEAGTKLVRDNFFNNTRAKLQLAMDMYGLARKDRQCTFYVKNAYTAGSIIHIKTRWAYHGIHVNPKEDRIRYEEKHEYGFIKKALVWTSGCSGILSFEVLKASGEFFLTVAIAFSVPVLQYSKAKKNNKFAFGVFNLPNMEFSTDEYQVMFCKTKPQDKTDEFFKATRVNEHFKTKKAKLIHCEVHHAQDGGNPHRFTYEDLVISVSMGSESSARCDVTLSKKEGGEQPLSLKSETDIKTK